MTVHQDDFYQFEHDSRTVARVPCLSNALPWPPAKHVAFNGAVWVLVRYSQLTDEQIAKAPNIARGALYVIDKSELPDVEDFGNTSATIH